MADLDGFLMTMNGLRYKILVPATEEPPAPTDTVTVHYRGWLDDGTEFDSSYARNEPTSFPLNAVIPGWTEGLQLIGPGGTIELEVPPQLGYGEAGAAGVIPPNATLHFHVELISTTPA